MKGRVSKEICCYLTAETMPQRYRTVIVSGGIAMWTGKEWLTKTGGDSGRPIQWPVEWWTPLLYNRDVGFAEPQASKP